MKRLYIIAAMAVATLAANAQEKLMLSTYNGTNIEKFDRKICDVTVNRYVFTGWNTVALPFDVTTEELNELFGNDCKLEQLVSVENINGNIQLNFQDCKASGLKANVPYLLHYTGTTGNKKITKEAAIYNEEAILTFQTQLGETVTMAGVREKTDGVGYYGILARDNAEAKFTKVDASLSGFLATRCYVQMPVGITGQVLTNHMAAGETTSINAIATSSETVDVYNTNGVKVAKINASKVNDLQPGVYVVKGQKVLVK